MFIIDDIVAIWTAVKAAWTAFKAIKIVGTALTVGKLLKAVQVVAFLGSLQRPKIASAGSELDLQIDPNAGLPIAIGERLTYGNLAYRRTDKGGKNNAEPNQILQVVKVLSSGGPIESIEYCKLGDNKVTSWSGNPLAGLATVAGCTPTTGKVYTYENNYHQRWSLGNLSGSVSTLAYFNAGGWTGFDSTSSLTGFAWVAEVLKKNDTTFPQSVPTAAYLIKGLKWYDWRKDSTVAGGSGSHRWDDPSTYEYSQNAFVVSYNYIRGRLEKTAGGLVVKSWGLHVNPDLIDLDSFNNAANIADALGWKVNAIGNTTDTPKAFLDKLLQCSGGYLISQGAKISAFINAPQTTVFDITDDDIVGDIEIPTSTSYRDRTNSVVPVYPEPALGFEDYYAEAITVQKYQDEDGEVKQTEINLDYCTDINQATQLAALELVNSREFLRYTVLCKPRLLQVRTGQTVTITSAGLNIAAQKCLVVGREIDLATFCVRLKLRSEDDAKYDWIQGLSPTAPDTKTLVGIDWATPGAPDADIFTVASFVDDDQIPAFLISGNVGDIPDAISTIRFDYKLSSASDWTFDGAFSVNDYDNISYAIRGLKPVTYYDIAISYVNSFGVVTDRTTFTNKLTSKLISNDTQNVGGVDSGVLVNTATQAYDLAWDAVNNAAALAAELTAQAIIFADGLAHEASDRANAIAASAASLQANIDALESQIDEASLAPAWSNTTAYTVGDIVTDNGSLWKAIANGTNHEPPSSYWVLIGAYDSINGAVDGLATQVNFTNTAVFTLQNAVTSQASDLTGVKARLSNVETKANTTASALTVLQANVSQTANTVASQANAITAVQSNVSALAGNVAGQSSAISGLQANSIAQGANIASQASQITALNSNVTALASNAAGYSSAIAGLQTNTVSLGNTISTQAGQITSLQSSFSNAGAENLLTNPSLTTFTSGLADGWITTGTYDSVNAGSVSPVSNGSSQRIAVTGLTTTVSADLRQNLVSKIQAGQSYTFSAFNSSGGAYQIQVIIQFYDASNTGIGTFASARTAGTGSWQRLTITGIAPTGTDHATVYCRIYGATTTGTATSGIYWALPQFELGDTATGWRDNNLALSSAIDAQSTAISLLQTNTASLAGLISTQAGQITSLQSNGVGYSTAIDALQTLTSQQGSNISTQASSITSLQSQINDSGADNLVYNPSFESGTATVAAEGWQVAGTYTSAVVQNLISYDGNQGKSQRINATGLTTTVYADLKTATGVEAQVTAGKTYSLSAYVNATASTFQHRMYIQFRNSAGTVLSTPQTALITSTGTWSRLTLTGVAPSGTVDAVIYLRTFGATTTASTAGVIFWDMVQLELGSVTGFRDNIRASTSAISGLQTSITTLGANVTATATSLTTLTASLSDTGGQNLFYNPSFSGSGTIADGWNSTVSSGGSVTNTLQASSRTAGSMMQKQAVSGLSSSIYSNLYISSTTNFAPVVYGQTYTLSVWVIATAGLTIRPYIFWHDASGTGINNNGTSVTATGSWQQITVTATNANNTQVYARPQLRVYSGSATAGSIYWDSVQFEQGSIATAWRDNPSASISSLQTVTASQSGDITALEARASLTVSAGGAVTGFSITSNAAAGSVFAIQADKFILTSGTKAVSPFSVDTVNNKVVATNLVVDTLQIKAGALTNYGYYQNAVAYNVDTASEVTFGSVTITTSGGWVDLAASLVAYSGLGSGYTYYDMKLYRDSTLLISVPRALCLFTYPGVPSQGASGIYIDEPAAGTYTYSWRGIVSSYSSGRSTNVTYRSLRAVEFKR